MIDCRLYRDGRLHEASFDTSRIDGLLRQDGTIVWLDLVEPSEDELAVLGEELGLHPLALEDASKGGQRTKVEAYEDHVFAVLHALELDERDELVERELHAFASPRYLVTVRLDPAFDLAPVLARWDRQPELTREGAGYLLYVVLDHVVDGYFVVTDRLEDRADDVEDRVFAGDADPGVQEAVFRLKRQAVGLRRRIVPMRAVPELLMDQPGLVTPLLRPYYRDVADHVHRVLESIDTARELLTAALEAELSQVSNRLNIVMKQVTSWAAIILIPTLITGIYGMNFRHMPELDEPWGYPFALGLMAASAFALYRVFRRRGWV